jgi:hypothetical protein
VPIRYRALASAHSFSFTSVSCREIKKKLLLSTGAFSMRASEMRFPLGRHCKHKASDGRMFRSYLAMEKIAHHRSGQQTRRTTPDTPTASAKPPVIVWRHASGMGASVSSLVGSGRRRRLNSDLEPPEGKPNCLRCRVNAPATKDHRGRHVLIAVPSPDYRSAPCRCSGGSQGSS